MMYGYGGWWMGLMMLVFWGGLIALVVWAILSVQSHQRIGGAGAPDQPSKALHILEERLARGEIDLEEFEQRKRALESR